MRRVLAAVAAVSLLFVPAPAQASLDPMPLRILAVGDSISELHPAQPELDWQTYLSDLLDTAGVVHTIDTAAVGGYRCLTWLPTIRAIVDAADPDIVIVSCGTNDAANGVTGSAMDAIYASLITEILIGHPPARILASWVQYSAGPGWLQNGEAVVNDSIFRQTFGSIHGTRIIGTADLQQIPVHYLDSGGIHPTAAGYEAMARIFYNRLRADAAYPWPDVSLPLCGMTGHRPGYGPPPFLPCNTLAT